MYLCVCVCVCEGEREQKVQEKGVSIGSGKISQGIAVAQGSVEEAG